MEEELPLTPSQQKMVELWEVLSYIWFKYNYVGT